LLVNLLDQTGQVVARPADEDQCDQVEFAVSNWAERLAGDGSGHELRAEPAPIIVRADLGAGFQRFFGPHVAAEKEHGERSAGDEA
jgi:hypothetical protein